MNTIKRVQMAASLCAMTCCLAAYAQNAPGEDPVTLSRSINVQMQPVGNTAKSGPYSPAGGTPAWMKAKTSRYEARAFSDQLGGILTDNDVVRTANAQGLQKACVQEIGSVNAAASSNGFVNRLPTQQIVVLRGDVVNVCR